MDTIPNADSIANEEVALTHSGKLYHRMRTRYGILWGSAGRTVTLCHFGWEVKEEKLTRKEADDKGLKACSKCGRWRAY